MQIKKSRLQGFILSLVLFSVFFVCMVFSQPADTDQVGAGGEGLISINFEDVDLRVVTNFVSKVTGQNFLLDDRVKGTVTIISPTKIPVGEVNQVFMSVLDVKGFTTIPSGRVVKIVPSANAKQLSLPTGIGKDISQIVFEDRMITQLIPLQYADSQQLLPILSPLISQQGFLTSYSPTNTLILTDLSSNIRKLLTIINNFDIEGSKLETSIIALKYASATEIAEKVSGAIENVGRTAAVTPTRTVRGGTPTTLPMASGGQVTLIPDERINSIILVANKDDTLKVKDLIAQLDILPPSGRETIHIYKLKYADAEALAKVLSAMPLGGGGTQAKGTSTAASTATTSISADVATRSLIITAQPEDYNHLKEVIDQLDTARPQVLVEALIADVSMDVLTDLGIEWATLDQPVEGEIRGFAGTRYTTSTGTTLGESALGLPGLILGAMKGTTTSSTLGTIPNVGMLIQAYSKRTGFNILSTPEILTLDNNKATIRVGENIPYITSSRITDQNNVINSYEYKDVGIELVITPHIGTEDNMKLDIHQTVTALSPAATGVDATTPTTTKREAETSVSVDDGSTIVIGGLIRDDTTKTLYKVPLLGDIPLLGLLFQRKEDTTERRNLLIFITPYIIREKTKIEELTHQKEELQDKFKTEQTIK